MKNKIHSTINDKKNCMYFERKYHKKPFSLTFKNTEFWLNSTKKQHLVTITFDINKFSNVEFIRIWIIRMIYAQKSCHKHKKSSQK